MATATARAGLTASFSAAVESQASAHGGQGGTRTGGGVAGQGGDASATAFSIGLGSATSRADATGGTSSGSGPGGAAFAGAQSNGASGTSLANATGSGGLLTSLFSSAYTEVGGLTDTQSRAAVARTAPDRALTTAVPAAMFSTGLPPAPDVASALAGNPFVAASMPGGTTFLSLGVAGVRHPPAGASINAEVKSVLRLNVSQLASPANLKVGFLDPVFTGTGFNSLRLIILRQLPPNNAATTVLDQTFPDLAAALVFFDNRTLDLGSILSGVGAENQQFFQINLLISTLSPPDSFNVNFLVANAPPSAAAPDLEIFAIRRAGQALRFEVSTLAGKTYRAQYSSLLSSGSWQFLAPSFPGTGSTVTVEDTFGFLPSRRFYNVIRFD